MKNRKLGLIISLVLIALIIVIIKFMPSFKKLDYREFYSQNENELSLLIDGEYARLDNTFPQLEGEMLYLPVDIVSEYIDSYVFYDETEQVLIITTENEVIRLEGDSKSYLSNNTSKTLEIPIYINDNVPYLPEDLLESLYPIELFTYKENSVVCLEHTENVRQRASVVAKKARIRCADDIKSEILITAGMNDTVTLYEKGESFSLVSFEGVVGYVENKALGEVYGIENEKTEYTPDLEENQGPISLVFDQITSVNANSLDTKREAIEGLDVIVPTWFSFKDESCEIRNIADLSYSRWAHSKGYKVWGLITDNFNSEISHAVLSSSENRKNVIDALLAYSEIYELDGINLDFESVPRADGELFVQFVRELAPLLHQRGLTLSVDTFVPKSWTMHYNRDKLAEVCDYIIVMGYDEHYSGSSESGSVASLSWSREAIESTLACGVPMEKLILGVPFYTRVWEHTTNSKGAVSLSSSAYSMEKAYEVMTELGGEFSYDEETEQNYCEAEKDGVVYKCWLEDAQSVEKRARLAKEYEIAGVGAWKRGFEAEGIWGIINAEIKG